MRNWTIPEIRLRNKEAGKHFFDRDTMNFFRSRVYEATYGNYFVTSEQFVSVDGKRDPRRFTVRRFNDDYSIDTVGEFQQHETLDDAMNEARRLAKLGDTTTATI
jgi:hypothetical protein